MGFFHFSGIDRIQQFLLQCLTGYVRTRSSELENFETHMVFKHFMFISFRASSWEDIILLSKTSTIGIARRKDEMTHFQNAVFEHLDCEKTGLICSIKQLRSVLKFCWRFLLEQRGFSSCIGRVNSVGIVSFVWHWHSPQQY